MTRRFALLAAALLLAACDAKPGGEDATGDGNDEDVEIPAALTEYARQARSDLAKQTGVAESRIRVVDAEFVTWRNSALGCPQPGMSYMQALTPGYRIRLETPDGAHDYHGANGQPPFHCPAERVTKPATTGGVDPRT